MGIHQIHAHRPRPVEIVDRIVGAEWWCLPLAMLPCGRVVLDGSRGEMIGKGLLEERDGGCAYRLLVDADRYPEVLDVRPHDRLTIDDARVFEVVSMTVDDQALLALDLARA